MEEDFFDVEVIDIFLNLNCMDLKVGHYDRDMKLTKNARVYHCMLNEAVVVVIFVLLLLVVVSARISFVIELWIR